MIITDELFTYWNYFLALEEDAYKISRFIQFHEDNYDTYSFELAKLLMATASQVDVVLREISSKYSNKKKENLNIVDYISLINKHLNGIISWKIQINKFGIKLEPLTPFGNKDANKRIPEWWTAYNKVKHNLDTEFYQANLKNVLNALGALFICVHFYYHLLSEEYAKNNEYEYAKLKGNAQYQQDAKLFSYNQRIKKPLTY